MRKQLLISALILLFLLAGTTIVVLYGKGYRFGFNRGTIDLSRTGLLVATSTPDGAQVFINDHLTTATDNTINLAPGEYTVRIFKEGYFPWEKKIKIQKEVVAKAEALLFPAAPKLESITITGAVRPVLDPSQTKLAYVVASQSARKNGIYILDMSARPVLTLQSASTQIADDTIDTLSLASLTWSPDARQIVATIAGELRTTTYLLTATDFNEAPQDITATLETYHSLWEEEKQEEETSRLTTLKPKLRNLISSYFSIVSWSPNETKILYQASTSATLPLAIEPRLVGIDSTPEQRNLKEGSLYIYDTKEDKNFDLGIEANIETQGQSALTWFSDSNHVIFVEDQKIRIMEYDGSNKTTLYAGPFVDNYVFPWPDGSKLTILTHLGNLAVLPNLYTISLK
ncbi:MAG: PEGA domain-containing protein [Candidatus Levybacteria bacterium]|nr:PEGA domain-containing protein [Candidatus Levybacteria bacterium]